MAKSNRRKHSVKGEWKMAEPQARPPKLTDEIASISKDIDIFTGWLARLENPDPVLRTESSGRGLKLYDEVARDAHTSAVLSTRYLSLSGCEWEIVAAQSPSRKGRPNKQSKEQQIADFVTQTLLACNFSQAVQELSQAALYGFYVAEILWKIDSDKNIGINRIITKHPKRFVFTAFRELKLLTPFNMIEGETLPDKKFITFTWGSSDNPYGIGLGQKLWWPVWFKKNGIKFWLVLLEKFGSPTVWGKYPNGTSQEQIDKFSDILETFQTDTGVTTPDTMQIELLEATRTGNVSYQSLLDYMDKQISKCVLGQTLTTEVSGTGSYAASKTHDEVRNDILKADADILAETLNDSLIRWIVDYNFDGVIDYPKLWFHTESEGDLFQLAQRDKILSVDCGLAMSKRYFYDTYGIPEPEASEELIAPAPKVPTTPTPPSAPALPVAAFGEISTLFPDQAAIDAVDSPPGDVMLETLKPIMDLIRQGQSYQEVEDNLMTAWPDMKTAEIEKLMERPIFVSEIWGKLNS